MSYGKNNIGFSVLALHSVLSKSKCLYYSNVFLILPIISHADLLSYLGRRNVIVQSLEQLYSVKTTSFLNFNQRFIDSLPVTINALQYLFEIEAVYMEGDCVCINKEFTYSSGMGKKIESVEKSAGNIAKLLMESAEKLYLNFRIEL